LLSRLLKGEFLVRRLATIALSFCLLLGLTGAYGLRAQNEPKKDETSKSEPAAKPEPKDEASKPEAKKDEASKTEPAKDTDKPPTAKPDASAATEAALPPIPPEVEAKLEAARRAVAEAIVAAQDAGLVKTSIDPPPILDILITGRANDESTLKAKTGVSPEVFGAWFTGYGTTKDINAQKDVRITRPDAGLKDLYSQRASVLSRHIEAIRKAQGGAKKDETKKETKDDAKGDDVKKDQNEKKAAEDDAKKDDKKGDGDRDKPE
jgi:hypothetical protein